MKKPFNSNLLSIFIIIAFLTLILGSCKDKETAAAPELSGSELLASANKLDSSFLAAFNRGDVNALMELYWNSPELIVYPPTDTMQLRGYAEIKDSYAKEFATNKGAKLEYTLTNNILFKDVVIGHGTFKWAMPMDSTPPIIFEGRYTEVKAMKDGKMVITVDHVSSPMIPPPPVDTAKVQEVQIVE